MFINDDIHDSYVYAHLRLKMPKASLPCIRKGTPVAKALQWDAGLVDIGSL